MTDVEGQLDNHYSDKLREENILFIGSYFNDEIDGIYSASYSLAANNKIRGMINSLCAVGASVTVISPISMNGDSLRFFRSRRVEDDKLGQNIHIPATIDMYALNYILLPIFTILMVIRELYRMDYDHIFFYNYLPRTALPAFVGSFLFGVPLIIEYEDGTIYHEHRVIRTVAQVLKRVCGSRINGAICASSGLADLAQTKNTVVVRGFPSVGFPSELPERSNEYGDTTIITFAGRFDQVRGIYIFLHMCEYLSDNWDNIEFWICGYGPEYENVEKISKNLPDSVSFYGTVPEGEYAKKIVNSDILVNFQDPDAAISTYTFPSKLLDFMSAGKVIVTTPVSDVKTELSEFVVITENEKPVIRDTLETVINDLETHKKEALLAQQWISEECNYENTGRQLASLLD